MSPLPSTAPQGLPGPAEPTETLRFGSRDGTGLYGEFFDVADAKGVALILHGYAEHCGRYRETAHVLQQAGLATLSFDFRGHGRADGQRGHITRFADYLDDVDAALAELDSRRPNLPLVMLAHSHGCLITLRMLADSERRPKRVAAAILVSPFLGFRHHVPKLKVLVGKIAGRILPTLSLPNDLTIESLTHDPQKLAERRVDTLCHEVASARWFTEALHTQAWVAEFVDRVDVPTLWLVAGGDKIADPDTTRVVHAKLRSPSVYREFPHMHHEVLNETERGEAFALIRAHVNEVI